MPTKEKEFAYITAFSSNVYKTISAAEARISRSSKVTWNYMWNITPLKSPGNLHLTLHLHYTFHSMIEDFSASCNTLRAIKLAASQANRLCSACLLPITVCRQFQQYCETYNSDKSAIYTTCILLSFIQKQKLMSNLVLYGIHS